MHGQGLPPGSGTAMTELPVSQPKRGRGVSWTYAETADLIALWGQPIVLEKLKQFHRNIETYNEVAEAMRAKGHQRTAEECRRKCKTLKGDYQKAREQYQSRAGRGAPTMPFFKELHAFLSPDSRPSTVDTGYEITRVLVGQEVKNEGGEDSLEAGGSQEILETAPGEQEDLPDSDETSASQRALDTSSMPSFHCGERTSASSRSINHRDRSPLQQAATAASDDSQDEERPDQEGPSHIARQHPVAHLTEFQRRRVRGPAAMAAASAIDRLMEQNSENMRKLLAHLEREGERHRMVVERSLQQQERLSATLEAQTALLATLVEVMRPVQGDREGAVGQGTGRRDTPEDEEEEEDTMEVYTQDSPLEESASLLSALAEEEPPSHPQVRRPVSRQGRTARRGRRPSTHPQ
ncbi:uncharacterized protein LOC121922701 [Sceloporus undulatus]|uniref:uncharacterized protein LOC121922701 n=1 Tax=Sceloporus undulatus TaxID=8520 RepID=UPI001C4B0E47|nr:uncharacterized protein LOC121922701 [Sceloporus undulatus]